MSILAGCGGGDAGRSLPFTRSPLDSTTTIWSVDIHVADKPGPAAFADIRTRLKADMVRIYFAPTDGITFYDALVANATAAGLRVDFLTPYPAAPYSPGPYGDIVRAAAARYAGMHLVWELINEPDFYVPSMTVQQCIAVDTAAAQAIRAVDPTATIVTGGTSGIDSNHNFEYDIAIGQALAPYVDGVGLHPYGVAPSAFASQAAQISLATGKPTWITEWATMSSGDLIEAMTSSRGATPMFDSYDYQTQSGEPNYGLIDNGLWTTYAQQAHS